VKVLIDGQANSISNIYIPVLCALRGFNAQGRDNARAEGKCIIRSRLLLHCPSALTKPVMHTKLVSKQFSATHPKPPLTFEKCALSDLKRGHVIDYEASDSLRVT